MRRGRVSGLGSALLLAGLVALIGWPATALGLAAFHWPGTVSTRGLIDQALAGEIVRPLGLALTTLRVVGLALVLALPAGAVLGFFLVRTDVWGRRWLSGIALLALFVPLPLHATAWLNAIGNKGRAQTIGTEPLLVGWSGAAIIHALAALPWVLVIMSLGFRTVERELEESGLLELPPWRVVTGITLRRSLGAALGAALVVVVLTAGDMTVTDLLSVRTYAEEAYFQFQFTGGPITAARLAIPPLVVLGGLLATAGRALMRADPARLISSARMSRTWRLGPWRWVLGLALCGTAGLILALPVGGLAWRAGRVGGRAAVGQPPQWSLSGLLGTLERAVPDLIEVSALSNQPFSSPVLTSTFCSALAATLVLVLGAGLAWAGRRHRLWQAILVATIALSLATPAPVTGMALKLAYLHVPAVHDTVAIVVLALAARTLPYALLLLWLTARTFPPEYLDMAELDAVPLGKQLTRVMLPITARSLMAAWGLAFVLALGELPASNLVLPPGVMTISLKVWSLLHNGVESHLAGLSLVLLGIYGLSALIASWLVLGSFRLTTRNDPR